LEQLFYVRLLGALFVLEKDFSVLALMTVTSVANLIKTLQADKG
jgi:hypothetical protein